MDEGIYRAECDESMIELDHLLRHWVMEYPPQAVMGSLLLYLLRVMRGKGNMSVAASVSLIADMVSAYVDGQEES